MRLGNAPTAVQRSRAWALYGGEPLQVAGVGVVIVAAYIGGMLLNDVIDQSFDEKHHPDRPLPQGLIPRFHAIAAAVFCGMLCLTLAGGSAQTEAVILLAAIGLYSWLHKTSVWMAALLLGTCRGMAVLLAAAMLGDGASGISTPIVLTLTVAHGAAGAAITVAASQEHRQRPGPGGLVPLARLLPLVVFVLARSSWKCLRRLGHRSRHVGHAGMARLGTRMRAEAPKRASRAGGGRGSRGSPRLIWWWLVGAACAIDGIGGHLFCSFSRLAAISPRNLRH